MFDGALSRSLLWELCSVDWFLFDRDLRYERVKYSFDLKPKFYFNFFSYDFSWLWFACNVKVAQNSLLRFFRKETDCQVKLETSTINRLSRFFFFCFLFCFVLLFLQGSFIFQIWKWGISRLEMDQIKTKENEWFFYSSFSLPVTLPITSCNCAFQKFVLVITHSFPVHPFSTPWKHQNTLLFSDVFRGYRKGALRTNGLKF